MASNASVHSFDHSRLEGLDSDAVDLLTHEADQDFVRRCIPGSTVIFLLLAIAGFISSVPADNSRLYFTVLSLSGITIGVHLMVLKFLADRLASEVSKWRALHSILSIMTALYWAVFSSWSLVHYGITKETLTILLFSAGIGSGAASALFIWKRIAQLYLVLVLMPPVFILVMLEESQTGWGISAGYLIYFIFLFFQVHRSHDEYWNALINTRLLEVQTQQLDEASQAKSIFLAKMSHELRTPMNAILGFSQVLAQDEKLSETHRNYVSEIGWAGKHLLELINEILDLSKIEYGHLMLETIEFDLFENIDEVSGLLAPLAHSKNIGFETYIDPAIARYVIGDPLRLRQVLTNLIGNAIKFTLKGKVRLQVSAEKPGLYLFEIHDEGVGIKQELQQKLFQPFVQADESTTRRYGGTGLGLAISDQLVKAMGGTIEIDSQLDKGATFWFKLPLMSSAKATAAVNLTGKRVLLTGELSADDAFRRYLENWGALCDGAKDANEAADLVATAAEAGSDYDLVAILEDSEAIDVAGLMQQLNLPETVPSCLLSRQWTVHCMNSSETRTDHCMSLPVKLSALIDSIDELFKPANRQEKTPSQNFADNEPDADITTEKTVLVVEDNLVNQILAEKILAQMGFNVVLANNGREAVEKVMVDDFDLIFMDIQMPVLDGYEATREIRELEKEQGGHRIIIAVTANAMNEDRERCIECGMDDYLSKPIDIEALQEKVKYWQTVLSGS